MIIKVIKNYCKTKYSEKTKWLSKGYLKSRKNNLLKKMNKY